MKKSLLYVPFGEYREELRQLISQNNSLQQRVDSWIDKAGIREKTLRAAALKVAEEYQKAVKKGINPSIVVIDSKEISRHVSYRVGFTAIWMYEEFKEKGYNMNVSLQSVRGSLEKYKSYLQSGGISEEELKKIDSVSNHLVTYEVEKRQ